MKITTFNPDGSIKDVSEYKFPIPYYIKKYEPGLFFINISKEDAEAVFYKSDDIEKDLLIDQYRFLIKYDFNNYKEYCFHNDCSFNILSTITEEPNNEEELNLESILLSLLRLYRTPISSIEGEWHSKIKSLFLSDMWLEVIVRHANITPNRKSVNGLLKKIISIIHRLHSVFKKLESLGQLLPEEYDVLFGLYPFADIHFPINTNISILDNNIVLAKVVKSFHYSNNGSRKFIYAIADMFESTMRFEAQNVQSKQTGMVSMVTGASNSNVNKNVIIQASPSNGVEIKEIELPQEEIVCLKDSHLAIGKDVLDKFGDALRGELDLFYKLNCEYVEKLVGIEATKAFRIKNTSSLTERHWEDLYFKSLDKLENSYIFKYEEVRELKVPYYYYYLLIEKCCSSCRYSFNDYFLESLAYMATQEKFIERSTLYYQMVRLNYMEEKASLIEREIDEKKSNPQEKAMLKERDKLFNSNLSDVAKSIFDDRYVGELTNDQLVQRIIVFLTPLFNEKYIVGMNVNNFKELLSRIYSNDIICRLLKQKSCNQQFDLMLVLNIIGFLSKDNVKWKSVITNPPVEKRKGNSLAIDLDYLWNTNLKDNYRKCVKEFDYILEKKTTKYYTKFTPAIKKIVEEEWNKYKEILKKRKDYYLT